MSNGINKVILVGRCGQDPEIRSTADGKQVATLSLATSKTWKDKEGNKQERTEWHKVVFFGKIVEIVSSYVGKGSQIYVEGELRTQQYEKDGVTKYSTEIVCRDMQMLSSKLEGSKTSYSEKYSTPIDSIAEQPFDDKYAGKDDVPF